MRALKAWGVSMLSDQEFNDWCHYMNLPQPTRQVISQIRDSQPIRRVKSSGINVRGDYASRKMGKTIQFELCNTLYTQRLRDTASIVVNALHNDIQACKQY